MYVNMGNHWVLCTTCFHSLSRQQSSFYSRHPGFHQRVRWAGNNYNGSSPNWPHCLIHNRSWTLYFNPHIASSRVQIGCTGEIQQLWVVPNNLHKISKVPDWHMMKCLYMMKTFPFSITPFIESISTRGFKGRISIWGKDGEVIIWHNDRKYDS